MILWTKQSIKHFKKAVFVIIIITGMRTIQVKSYAKINIALNVVGKREDGYHELDMVMLPIELHDSILVNKLGPNAVDNLVRIDDFSISSPEYNSVSVALKKLCDKYNYKERFNIFVHKNVPVQGGLGGGSSDAAFAIRAINKYLNLGASDDDLCDVCKGLGGDAPFFVRCKPSRCQGIGEIITPINLKNDYNVLIVKPKKGCSTKGIYKISDEMKLDVFDMDKVVEALEEGDDDKLLKYMGNSLEKPAISTVPEIQEIKDVLKGYGFKIVQMSGSGSSVFALSNDKALIKKVYKELEDKYIVFETKVIK